ncbi:MAG: sulfotransferase [Actinobacteria bacterium]|nr:sulfotransferase [Actinomycetota bacterium]
MRATWFLTRQPADCGTVGQPADSLEKVTMPLVVLVAPPRSGATLLSLALTQGEGWAASSSSLSAAVDSIAGFRTTDRGLASDRLTAADATPELTAALQAAAPPSDEVFVEWSARSSMQVGLIAQALPDAKFVFLTRRPLMTVSSSMVAWSSGRFVSQPDLPDWWGDRWSFPLIDGWRELIGAPLAQVCATQWNTITNAILDDLAELPPDRWTVSCFESLVEDPAAEVTRIAHDLGLAWSGQMLDPLPPTLTCVTPPESRAWRGNASEAMTALEPRETTVMRMLSAAQERVPGFTGAGSRPSPEAPHP